LVYALEGTAEHGWGSARTLVLLAVSAVLLTGFAAIERRVGEPILPPATWRIRSLVTGVGLMFVATGLLVGAFFLNTIYLQHVLGWSALEAGFAFLPLMLVTGFGAHIASRLIPRIGSRGLAAGGLALMAASALLLAAAPDDAGYVADLLPGFLVLGLGVGLVFPAASVTTMSEVHDEGAGLASGLMTTGHEVGAAIGVATFSAVATAAATFPAGYGDAFLAVAGAAGILAAVVLTAVPSVRPTGETRLAMH
jgi:MFS family permease